VVYLTAVIPSKASEAVKPCLLCLYFNFLFIFVIQKGKNKIQGLMKFHTQN